MHSYDVALIDTEPNQTPAIPAANSPYFGHITDGNIGAVGPDGGRGLFVGYGCNPITPSLQRHKQSAHFAAASWQTWDAAPCEDCDVDAFALYTREILTLETGAQREGTCSGDSGGPLFRYSPVNGYRVVGVSSTGVNDVAAATHIGSGFTRLNNVRFWLAQPEKLNVIAHSKRDFC